MNGKLTLWFLAFVCSSSFVLACTDLEQIESTDQFFEELSVLESHLSSCTITLPPVVSAVYRNAVFQVSVSGESTRSFSIVISDGVVSEISNSLPVSPDYNVDFTERNFDDFLSSEDSGESFSFHYKHGDVTISANRFPNHVRLFFTRPFLRWL